jgi:hypothetical protein
MGERSAEGFQIVLESIGWLSPGESVCHRDEEHFRLFDSTRGLSKIAEAPEFILQAPAAFAKLQRESHTVFARMTLDAKVSDISAVVDLLKQETWLGSSCLPIALHDRSLLLRLGAQEQIVRPNRPIPVAAASFEAGMIAAFEATPARVATFRITQPGAACRNSRRSAADCIGELGISLNRQYGFICEVPLRFEYFSLTTDHVDDLCLQRAVLHLGRVDASCSARVERHLDSIIAETVSRLNQRKHGLRHRTRLEWIEKGTRIDLGPQPENENETLILLGKLETWLNQILPYFRILEHTSLLGIDGLLDIQLALDSARQFGAPVEFEFELVNFFQHQHPIRQTSYIICWTARGLSEGFHSCGVKGLDEGDGVSFEYRGEGWIRTLQFADHQIHVLILEELPNLRIISS